MKNKDKKIQADCIKTLYEIGYIKPELIAAYFSDFISLLSNKNNRLVWGAMIALLTITDSKNKEVFASLDLLSDTIEKGSVITQDNGIKILAKVASMNSEYGKVIIPYLMEQLRNCRSKSVPQYAESIRIAVNKDNQEQFLSILNERLDSLSVAQQMRVKKLLRTF